MGNVGFQCIITALALWPWSSLLPQFYALPYPQLQPKCLTYGYIVGLGETELRAFCGFPVVVIL